MNRSLFRELWDKVFRAGNPLFLFIGLNCLVFILLNLAGLFVYLRILPAALPTWLIAQFQLPAYLPALAWKPWTLVSYMFAQISFFHLLFNMLWLYWMGRIFLDFLSRKQFVFVYLAGGLAGAFIYLLSYALIPVFSEQITAHVLIGSSASVSAVIFATATLLPDYSIRMLFLGNVKLKYLALAFLVLDLLGVGGSNAGGSLAHIGGAFLGYLYIRQLRSGRDWSKIFKRKRRSKLKVVKNPRSFHDKSSDADNVQSNKRKKTSSDEMPNQMLIDQILDKISKSGYDSLSKKEKEALFKASNQKN
ncbi:MAG TPA: rhomboid family intramembrane serine protease [Sphingobacteriaceae bacterium]|nr:rhomboid family intramembrane serine protease [Sphingobacteriaceae bacterium]